MSEQAGEHEVFLSTSVSVAAGLLGGFFIGRLTRRPSMANAIFGGVGVLVGTQWFQNRGPRTAAVLGTVYLGAMGLSRAFDKKVGAVPVMALTTAAAAAAAYALHDKHVTVGLDPAEQP